jgi:hypothetical protein
MSEGARLGMALVNNRVPEDHVFTDGQLEAMRGRLVELTTGHGEAQTKTEHGKRVIVWEPTGLISQAEKELDRALNGYSSGILWFAGINRKLENMRPAHREREWQKWREGEGKPLYERVEYLKREAQALEAALKRAEEQKAEAKQLELNRLSSGLPEAVKGLEEAVRERREVIDAVTHLASLLNGHSLQQYLSPVLGMRDKYQDIAARHAYCLEQGVKLPALPECPEVPNIQGALQQILGVPVNLPPRNRKWSRQAARLRAQRKDEEALRRMRVSKNRSSNGS